MITYTPQGGQKHIASYELEGMVLKVVVDGIEEEFDFTGLEDGEATFIKPEKLLINPIVRASITKGELDVEVIHFYTEEEIPLYERPLTEEELSFMKGLATSG